MQRWPAPDKWAFVSEPGRGPAPSPFVLSVARRLWTLGWVLLPLGAGALFVPALLRRGFFVAATPAVIALALLQSVDLVSWKVLSLKQRWDVCMRLVLLLGVVTLVIELDLS